MMPCALFTFAATYSRAQCSMGCWPSWRPPGDIGAREEVNQHGADEDEPLDGEPVPTMDEALGTEGAEGPAH